MSMNRGKCFYRPEVCLFPEADSLQQEGVNPAYGVTSVVLCGSLNM